MNTAYRAITNDNGDIELTDLYNDDGSFHYQPALKFTNAPHEHFWDNPEYILETFKALKSRKKNKHTLELKQFCLDNKFDYKIMKKELRAIYKTAKILKFWKK